MDTRKVKKVVENLCPMIEDEDETKFDECFRQLLDIRDGKDGHQWQTQVNNKDFKQFVCLPDDRPVVLIKASTVVKAPVSSLVDCSIDFEARSDWDKSLYDF